MARKAQITPEPKAITGNNFLYITFSFSNHEVKSSLALPFRPLPKELPGQLPGLGTGDAQLLLHEMDDLRLVSGNLEVPLEGLNDTGFNQVKTVGAVAGIIYRQQTGGDFRLHSRLCPGPSPAAGEP